MLKSFSCGNLVWKYYDWLSWDFQHLRSDINLGWEHMKECLNQYTSLLEKSKMQIKSISSFLLCQLGWSSSVWDKESSTIRFCFIQIVRCKFILLASDIGKLKRLVSYLLIFGSFIAIISLLNSKKASYGWTSFLGSRWRICLALRTLIIVLGMTLKIFFC